MVKCLYKVPILWTHVGIEKGVGYPMLYLYLAKTQQSISVGTRFSSKNVGIAESVLYTANHTLRAFPTCW